MTMSCRECASSPFLPLTPFVSFFAQGAFFPSAIATSVLLTAFPPSGVRVRASAYRRTSFGGLRYSSSIRPPVTSVSSLTFEADILPQPSRASASRASLKEPSCTARRETVSDAHGVIFRSMPNALRKSSPSSAPRLYG